MLYCIRLFLSINMNKMFRFVKLCNIFQIHLAFLVNCVIMSELFFYNKKREWLQKIILIFYSHFLYFYGYVRYGRGVIKGEYTAYLAFTSEYFCVLSAFFDCVG